MSIPQDDNLNEKAPPNDVGDVGEVFKEIVSSDNAKVYKHQATAHQASISYSSLGDYRTGYQIKPTRWIAETPLHFTHASWLVKHLTRSYSSFHDWYVSGTDINLEWSPNIPEGETNYHLVTVRTFTLKLIPAHFLGRIFGRFYNPNIYKPFGKEAEKRVYWKYIITIHYRRGINQGLCEAGYGRWLGEIIQAVKQKQIRTRLSLNFDKIRGN